MRAPQVSLNALEMDVLEFVGAGRSNAEVASELFVTETKQCPTNKRPRHPARLGGAPTVIVCGMLQSSCSPKSRVRRKA